MRESLSPKQQRILALVLLFLAGALLWAVILEPALEHRHSGADNRHAVLRALQRERGLLAQEPKVRVALTALEQSPRWARFYDTQKPDQAIFQLEKDLRGIIKASSPISMVAEPASAQGPLTRIAVQVSLSMPIDQLAETLARVQSHSKLLKIDRLTIQAPDFQSVDTNPTLSIQAEIAGFLVTPAAART